MKLVKHTIYNLLGLGLPLVVAVFSIPILIKELGDARFGLLTLIWAVVSYFGLFDLGLGRALTQKISVELAGNDHRRVAPLVTTALALMTVMGLFAGALLATLAAWGVSLIKLVPNASETVEAVYWMALAMPFIVLTSGFRGILEAYQEFGIVNAIRLPMGLFTFLGPMLVVLYTPWGLDGIAAVLVVGRIAACVIHGWFCFRVMPKGIDDFIFASEWLKPLCVSGGWMTLSNIISPFMGYVDRFIIGGVVTAAAVAYYTTPLEIVTKLWIIPAAITGVMFPAFASQLLANKKLAKKLFHDANYLLYYILLPATSFLAVFSYEIISLWVGSEFAKNSAIYLQIFAFGILINCMAHVPFTLIQSAGLPRLVALLHLIELPIYILALWWLGSKYGAIGAAYAWLGRMILDTILMYFVSLPILGSKFSTPSIHNLLKYTAITATAFSGIFIHIKAMQVIIILFTVAISVKIFLGRWRSRLST